MAPILPPLVDTEDLLASGDHATTCWDGRSDLLLGCQPMATPEATEVSSYIAAAQQLAWERGLISTWAGALQR